MSDTTELRKHFAEVLDDFESGYMAARNLAPRSRIDYRKDAQDSLEYLEKSGANDLEEVSPYNIHRKSLSGLGATPSN